MTGERIPRALTVAGSDSGGGAGIQADLKTFLALGVYGMSAITALTAQNTRQVTAVHEVPPAFVAAQIDAVVEDLGADAVKTGMLANAGIIEAVADRVRRHRVRRLVVDPVMVAKSGDPLLRPDARDALVRELLPLALVVTPNLPEAEVLVKRPVRDRREMEEAARALHDLGAAVVVVKGGHQDTDEAADVCYDGRTVQVFRAPRLPTRNTHGTGCTFSAAIAAWLALGLDPAGAVARAKAFITDAIRQSLAIGGGRGPTNPGGLVRPVRDAWVP